MQFTIHPFVQFTVVPFGVTFTYKYKDLALETLYLDKDGTKLEKFVSEIKTIIEDQTIEHFCLDFNTIDESGLTQISLSKSKEAPLELSQLSAFHGSAQQVKNAIIQLTPNNNLTAFTVTLTGDFD